MTLPVPSPTGNIQIADPDTGALTEVRDASDRALLTTVDQIAEHLSDLHDAKRLIAAELRERHGIGRSHQAGFEFKITEFVSWPLGATRDALNQLVREGHISQGDYDRAMPARPKPDPTQLKALAARLAMTNADAYRILIAACTVSPPSVGEVEREDVDEAAV